MITLAWFGPRASTSIERGFKKAWDDIDTIPYSIPSVRYTDKADGNKKQKDFATKPDSGLGLHR